jgi:hypothetical protein
MSTSTPVVACAFVYSTMMITSTPVVAFAFVYATITMRRHKLFCPRLACRCRNIGPDREWGWGSCDNEAVV